MLRKSNTSSNIPLPKNLFNTDGGARKRSASGSRFSQRNSTASTVRPRAASIEGKPSMGRLSRPNSPNRLSKLTPQNPPKRGRPNSLQKVTPYSEQKTQTNKLNTGSALKSRERKTIQKLSTDVTWVAHQYAKVKDFIVYSGLFDSTIVTESNIRPPSIKVFIYVTTVLMTELFYNLKITNENYKEVIPEKLKVLNYPGTFANSVLKTVNTMHVWPQVIGMFGWLIDKINLRLEITIDLDILEPFYRESYQITQVCKLYFLERYAIFNNGNDEEKTLQANERYVKDLKDILQVDPESYQHLQTEITKNTEYKLKQDGEIQNLNEDIIKLRKEKTQLQQEIDDIEEKDVILETEIEGEIEHLQAKLKKAKDKNAAIALRVANLEESIKNQPCSYQEKLNLLKTIDSLNDENRIKKEKMEHAKQLKQEFDATLNEERVKLLNKVSNWNKFLMKWTIKKPQLKPLLLKETGFHNPSYLTEIDNVMKHKIAIESDFAKELQELGIKLEQEKKANKILEVEMEDLIKSVNDLTTEYQNTHQIAEDTEEKLRNLNTEYELMKKTFEQELKQLNEKKEVEELKRQASDLQVKKDTLEVEVEKFAKKTLAFFLDLYKQINKDLQDMVEIRNEAIENRMVSQIEQQKALIEKLGKLTTKDD